MRRLTLYSSLFLLVIGTLNKYADADIASGVLENCKGNNDSLENFLTTTKAIVRFCIAECLGLASGHETSKRDPCSFSKNVTTKIIPSGIRSDAKIYCNFQVNQASSRYANLTSLVESGLCSHIIIHGFAEISKIDDATFSVERVTDQIQDITKGLKKIVSKYNNTKLLLSIGENTIQSNQMFSEMVTSTDSRSSFIKSLMDFLVTFNFTGLHVKWTYPVCWMDNCKLGPKSDKKNFAFLMSEVSERLKEAGFSLSFTLSLSPSLVREGIDIATIYKLADMIILPTHHYRGPSNKKLGYSTLVNDIRGTIDMFKLSAYADLKKFVPEIFAWTEIYLLLNKTKTRTGSAAAAFPNIPDGMNSFEELCFQVKKDKWTVSRIVSETSGFYAYKDDKWVSYEDVASVQLKVKYFKSLGMLGVSFYSVNADDFSGRCGCGNFPLLRAVSEELRGGNQELQNCT